MSKKLTDEEVRAEIERLKADANVKKGKQVIQQRYKERQKLYTMRYLQKLGAAAGMEAAE